ncbi:MAG: hypothetical protein MJ153_08730, partial [Clostridia bacterium]|nr:hypothetical protein [Clostridia bacterium]
RCNKNLTKIEEKSHLLVRKKGVFGEIRSGNLHQTRRSPTHSSASSALRRGRTSSPHASSAACSAFLHIFEK